VDLCTLQLETDTTRTKRIAVGNLESTLRFRPDTWRRARRVDFGSVSCRVGDDRTMAYHFSTGRLWVIAIQFRCTSKSVDLYAGTNSRRIAAKIVSIRYSGVIKIVSNYQSRVNDRLLKGKDGLRCVHILMICKCRKRFWGTPIQQYTDAATQMSIE